MSIGRLRRWLAVAGLATAVLVEASAPAGAQIIPPTEVKICPDAWMTVKPNPVAPRGLLTIAAGGLPSGYMKSLELPPFPSSYALGDVTEFTLDQTAPAAPGAYTLILKVSAGNVAWTCVTAGFEVADAPTPTISTTTTTTTTTTIPRTTTSTTYAPPTTAAPVTTAPPMTAAATTTTAPGTTTTRAPTTTREPTTTRAPTTTREPTTTRAPTTTREPTTTSTTVAFATTITAPLQPTTFPEPLGDLPPTVPLAVDAADEDSGILLPVFLALLAGMAIAGAGGFGWWLARRRDAGGGSG